MRQQQLVDRRPVLLGNEVVEDGVDGGAQVEELQGEDVEVLGEEHHPGVLGVYENDPANVERQPANYKGQNHHSYKTKQHVQELRSELTYQALRHAAAFGGFSSGYE